MMDLNYSVEWVVLLLGGLVELQFSCGVCKTTFWSMVILVYPCPHPHCLPRLVVNLVRLVVLIDRP